MHLIIDTCKKIQIPNSLLKARIESWAQKYRKESFSRSSLSSVWPLSCFSAAVPETVNRNHNRRWNLTQFGLWSVVIFVQLMARTQTGWNFSVFYLYAWRQSTITWKYISDSRKEIPPLSQVPSPPAHAVMEFPLCPKWALYSQTSRKTGEGVVQ